MEGEELTSGSANAFAVSVVADVFGGMGGERGLCWDGL